MELIYTVPDDVIHYDRVFEAWNTLVEDAKQMSLNNAVQAVASWWDNYAQDTASKKLVEKYDVPRNVWKILENFKINNTEKVYGIYYTLSIIFGECSELKISSIQFTETGEVDVAVIVENLMVCNGIFTVESTNYTELSNWEDNIKVIH